MEKHVFSITVNAPREKVWNTLWSDDTYPQWTAIFAQGSRAETDWKKGSKVLFLGETNEGMVSTIAENIPNEYMSFQHLGVVKNGVEDMESPDSREWAGSHENYTLKTVNGQTEVTVDIDIADRFREYFLETWPQALEKLKTLAENN
jgi:uncharacterized protein YndB with AHSA1/START domain